ncbi:MAG: 30S ribosomal protein S5 [Lentisphaeria bacterium]|nr:30S ribosomal protein S5 [Lentisphaeria bacterium]
MATEKVNSEVKEEAAAPVEEQVQTAAAAASPAFKPASEEEGGLGEVVLSINRCSKVVKGGRNFSFGALVVVGDRNGKVGYGYGKANEVSDAIRKGGEAAKKNMVTVARRGDTVPHSVEAKYRGSKIIIRPASEGTGMIAGGTMRAVLGLAGVVDVLTKSQGSSNPMNVVKATFKAIESMKTKDQVMEKRGKK